MSSHDQQSAVLTAHPSTPNDAVRRLAVQVRAEDPDILAFQYSLAADMSRVRVPRSGTGGRAGALWEHTCFEAFVAAAHGPGYVEFNFSSSLEWAVYQFSAYRAGMSPVQTGQDPQVSVRQHEGGLELRAAVCLGRIDHLRDVRHLRIALAAVIEDDTGRLSYWGLTHPPGKPDFHHPNAFALEITRS
jgi:hypothetical protein